MRVLLTGLTGRIGIHVLRDLYQQQHEIVGLTRGDLSREARALVTTLHYGDISAPETWLRALQGVEAVVHMAGISAETSGAFRVNVQSTHVMAGACAEVGVRRIIFASSNCVLGHCDRAGGSRFAFHSLPIDENHPLAPESDYGLSKFVSEQVLQAASRRWGLTVVALRLSWVWDESQCARRTSSAWDETGQAPGLWAYVHVADCAQAFRLAAESLDTRGFEAVYISAADTTADAPSRDLVAQHYPELVAHTTHLSANGSLFSWKKARSIIGYEPKRTWRS